jgi:hypothetical protein
MDKVLYEQPSVATLEQYYVVVEGVTSDGLPFQAAWTSHQPANDLLGPALRPMSPRASAVRCVVLAFQCALSVV